jgi:hypothetical protein
MDTRRSHMRGFTLIASLLVLVLLSGVAIGLMYLTNGEGHIGSNDLEDNLAYYGAESGMEKMTADLAALYVSKMVPSITDIANVAGSTNWPDSSMVSNMGYFEQITYKLDPKTNLPAHTWHPISAGNNQGLIAEIVPLTLQATATRPSGATVNMYRTVEVALIPVFQFGVFSDSDLSYFAGPPFEFQGRVHTNGNLFLAANAGPLVLDDKVTAVGEIVRDTLANGWTGGGNYQGDVYIPTVANACDPPWATAIANPPCLKMAMNQGSWTGGIPPAAPVGSGTPNASWSGIQSGYNGFVATGVQPLNLPFVQNAGGTPNSSAQQIQIIRKPLAGASASAPLGSSQLYNKAQIRVLLANTEADLRPGIVVNDGEDFQLDGLPWINTRGTPGGTPGALTSNFAVADTAVGDIGWTGGAAGTIPHCGNAIPSAPCNPYPGGTTKWPLIRGWLRVEYFDSGTQKWTGVTDEWLDLGFARSLTPRTTPGVDVAPGGHPNAILLFQQLADRDGDGKIDHGEPTSATGPASNFYPINFYDTREGEPFDAVNGTPFGASTCRMNGIMNAVELDVGNLQQWLSGKTGTKGAKVDWSSENGYVLYFSDRRGMENEPVSGLTNGEYGFEDVINSTSAGGEPDGKLEPATSTGYSPEDIDENKTLDIWGAADVGDGFGGPTWDTHGTLGANYWGPYQQIDCMNGGRQAWVSGARHALKLIDGSLNYVPTKPDGTGGFTVASENPVYVQGDYNSNAADPFWTTPAAADVPHAAASIIADAVTLLSNNWSDRNSMANPTTLNQRLPSNTYYRMAIAAGKNMTFPQFGGNGRPDFGTDGGVHNFLRLLENWGGTLSYRGSLVSLYYSEYATGTFKCCTMVYSAPNRNFYFDTAFLDPTNLPPATPEFQDIVNLNYYQNFTPQ